VVEIELQWTARNRERMGVVVGIGSQNPRPVSAKNADTTTGPARSSSGTILRFVLTLAIVAALMYFFLHR
jgi:hypothetical protein